MGSANDPPNASTPFPLPPGYVGSANDPPSANSTTHPNSMGMKPSDKIANLPLGVSLPAPHT